MKLLGIGLRLKCWVEKRGLRIRRAPFTLQTRRAELMGNRRNNNESPTQRSRAVNWLSDEHVLGT